jgi:hypothetical protein
MLRREHHVVAPNNVSGAVNTSISDALCSSTAKNADLCCADPVALHRLDRLGPVEQREIVGRS